MMANGKVTHRGQRPDSSIWRQPRRQNHSGGMTIEDNKPTPRRGRATPTLFTSNSNPTMPGNNTKKSQGEQRRRSIQYSPSSSPLSPFAVKNGALSNQETTVLVGFGWINLDLPGSAPWITDTDAVSCFLAFLIRNGWRHWMNLDQPGFPWISPDHRGLLRQPPPAYRPHQNQSVLSFVICVL